MNDLVEGCRVTGNILFEGKTSSPKLTPRTALSRRHGIPAADAVPEEHFENVAYGPRIQGISNTKELEQIVEESLKQAAIWDELKIVSTKVPWASLVASNNVYALPARWQPSRRSS